MARNRYVVAALLHDGTPYSIVSGQIKTREQAERSLAQKREAQDEPAMYSIFCLVEVK